MTRTKVGLTTNGHIKEVAMGVSHQEGMKGDPAMTASVRADAIQWRGTGREFFGRQSTIPWVRLHGRVT